MGHGPGLVCGSSPAWPEGVGGWRRLLPGGEDGAAAELAARWAERGLSAKLEPVSQGC